MKVSNVNGTFHRQTVLFEVNNKVNLKSRGMKKRTAKMDWNVSSMRETRGGQIGDSCEVPIPHAKIIKLVAQRSKNECTCET